jgi:hypothetical protein
MEKNEIKKGLYKENPTAYLIHVRGDGILYQTGITSGTVHFLIPLGEVGEVIWETEMEAKLLIRWLE